MNGWMDGWTDGRTDGLEAETGGNAVYHRLTWLLVAALPIKCLLRGQWYGENRLMMNTIL